MEGEAPHLKDDSPSICQKAASWLLKISSTFFCSCVIFFRCHRWGQEYLKTTPADVGNIYPNMILYSNMKESSMDVVYFKCKQLRNLSVNTQSTMEVSWLCDWSLLALHVDRQAKNCWMLMISLTRPKPKILQERIICIEQGHLKNRTFFVLTDCCLHSNFRQGSTQKTAKYKPHYTPCHRSFIDTWGIKKWQRCRAGGCNGTKMCHEWMWWYQRHAVNQTIRCIPTRWQSEPASFFSRPLQNIMQKILHFIAASYNLWFYTAILKFLYAVLGS